MNTTETSHGKAASLLVLSEGIAAPTKQIPTAAVRDVAWTEHAIRGSAPSVGLVPEGIEWPIKNAPAVIEFFDSPTQANTVKQVQLAHFPHDIPKRRDATFRRGSGRASLYASTPDITMTSLR